MPRTPTLSRAILVGLTAIGAALSQGCSSHPEDRLTGPSGDPQFSAQGPPDFAAAIAAQQRYTPALMRIPGVQGTAVGLTPGGRPVVRVFLLSGDVRGLPGALDGVPVAPQVTGRFMVISNPTSRARPAPVGFSIGHPSITAGSIGARVRDGAGNVYILSNNHVLANSNSASIGDPALQPGPYDGGTLNDQVGTLSAFQTIDFSLSGRNTMDAAIARTTTDAIGNATPSDDGYGPPNGAVFGDANGDGLFDNRNALLGIAVQKYGRTTRLTRGTITGINATVEICYEVLIIFCVQSAYFVDQIIIEPGSFSGGGDSGSLIVTDNAQAYPVGLLFAGSSTMTIANRIDLVLTHFGVAVDGANAEPPPPPTPVTDLAVTGVSAPSAVTQGSLASVQVSVRNQGNQDVAADFHVTLTDETDGVTIGTQTVAGLGAGATTVLNFSWNTAGSSFGPHTLRARHDVSDDQADNDSASAGVTVTDPAAAATVHVGDLDSPFVSNDGSSWSAVVEVAVHDGTHQLVNGVTVVGTWSPTGGLASTQCTTGDGGGNGTCIFLFTGIRKNVRSVSFTVTGVAQAGKVYEPTLNHDPDGDSNGTTITVRKP